MKFATGQLMGNCSGSIGGTTFSRNRFGAYVRNRSVPVNRNTALQIIVRNILKTLSQYWSSTLDAQMRGQWDVFAANTPIVDALGQTQYATGFNMFVKCNSVRQLAGLAIVDNAPAVFTLPPPAAGVVLTATEDDQNLSIAYTSTEDWAGEVGGALVIQAGEPQSATRNFFAGPYRYAGKVAGASTPPTSPIVLTSPYQIQAGQIVFLQVRVVRADGRVSSPFQIVGTVASGA